MASKEEIRLTRMIMGLAMEITAQGVHKVQCEYYGHLDQLSVWLDGDIDGWGCNDHTVYLGDFYLKPWSMRDGKSESANQLVKLSAELKKFLLVDEDGVSI